MNTVARKRLGQFSHSRGSPIMNSGNFSLDGLIFGSPKVQTLLTSFWTNEYLVDIGDFADLCSDFSDLCLAFVFSF